MLNENPRLPVGIFPRPILFPAMILLLFYLRADQLSVIDFMDKLKVQ